MSKIKLMRNKKNIIILSTSIMLFFISCKEEIHRIEPELPFNPFDTITFEDGVLDEIEIDSSSLLGLHTFIFKPTCAIPSCHDGTFEPDFRTVQSAYNTLVYHPVIKNDEDESFTYRVIPGNLSKSWLHERITTEDETLGRMPLYDSLTNSEIAAINKWIEDGAQDVMGFSAILPVFTSPATSGFLAYLNDTVGERLDENRADIVSPILLPDNETIEIWFGVYDFDADSNFAWGNALTYNKARISSEGYNVTDYDEYTMEVEPVGTPFIGPLYWDDTYTTYYYQHFTFNTADYTPGKIYFIRFYVQDDEHAFPTEIPDDGYNPYLMTYFSFIVQE